MKEFKWRCSFWFESIQCGGWKIAKIPNIILLKNSLEEKQSPTWTMGRLIDLHGFVPAADQTCSPCRWIHLARKPTTPRRLVLWNPSQLCRYWPKTIGGSKLPDSFPSTSLRLVSLVSLLFSHLSEGHRVSLSHHFQQARPHTKAFAPCRESSGQTRAKQN